VHLHPEGGEKMFRCNLQGNLVSAPPADQVHSQAEEEDTFAGRGYLEVYLVAYSLRRFFEGDDYKKVVNFSEEKSAPPDKILATLMNNCCELRCCRRHFVVPIMYILSKQ